MEHGGDNRGVASWHVEVLKGAKFPFSRSRRTACTDRFSGLPSRPAEKLGLLPGSPYSHLELAAPGLILSP